MGIHRTIVVFFGLLMLAGAGPSWAGDPCSEPVQTAAGLVRGGSEIGTETCVWRGIPYAAPPQDELRWKAPQPAGPWAEVRETVKWGDRCMQSGGIMGGGGAPGAGMSEDCLNLNIWSPKKSGKFPVLVWVHGGGYYVGSGSDPAYWGDRLAEAGEVIVVTVNYRLGLFGFMAHPALREEDPDRSTGGYGTLDQVFALNWVHENIENFGGDPDNVTIFGQSAGGASICTLVATPLAKGLFHRAIMQSGLCELSQDLEAGYQLTREAAKKLGCGFDDLKCLRNLPGKKILDRATGTMMEGFIYVPCHDGHVLTGTPLAMIKAGNYNPVQFMTGTVLDEFGKALKLTPRYYYTRPANYQERLAKSFKMSAPDAQKLAALYPLEEFQNRPVEAIGRMFGADAAMQCPSHRGLVALAGPGNQAWFYRFDYHGMKYGKFLGSFHTAELPFIFGAFDRPPAKTFYKGRDLTQERELSRVMQGYWTNFAKTGDPNGQGLPKWEAFSIPQPMIQVLDTSRVQSQTSQVADRCGFWEGYAKEFLPFANQLIGSLL